MFYETFHNIFKDRTLPHYAHYINQDIQHPLQYDKTHPAHADHPENPINQIKSSGDVIMITPRASGAILRSGANSPVIRSGACSPVLGQSKNILKQTLTLTDPNSQSPHLETTLKKDSVGIPKDPLFLEPRPDPNEGVALSILVTHGNEHHDIMTSGKIGVVSSPDSLASHVVTSDHGTSDTNSDHHGASLIKNKISKANLTCTEYVKKTVHKVKRRLFSNIPKVRAKVEKVTVDSVYCQTVVIPFLLELGKALHVCGVPAHRLEYELTLVATSFGIEGNYFYTPTGIFCSFGDPNTLLSPYTHLIRVGGSDFDLEKLCLLEELALDISQKRLNCNEGITAIHSIMSLPPRYPRGLVVLSVVLCSFAIAIMFGLGWIEVGVTSLAALYVSAIIMIGERVSSVARIMEAISGLGCGFIAAIFSGFVVHINMFIVALGGVIWFVPGLSITLAVAELSTRNLISGTTRLMSAFACILQLTFGIEAGMQLGQAFFHSKEGVATEPLSAYWNYFATVIAAVSFAVLLRVPPKQVWSVFIACFLGTIGGQYATEVFGNSIGAFFGALLICIFGNIYARLSQKSVSSVPIICGILLLVPGSLGVKALTAIGNDDTQTGIANLGNMFQTAMSLAMGLLTANLLVRPYKAL